jgi:hypothetical protein
MNEFYDDEAKQKAIEAWNRRANGCSSENG